VIVHFHQRLTFKANIAEMENATYLDAAATEDVVAFQKHHQTTNRRSRIFALWMRVQK
jgi:hypothetical protein